VGDWHDTLLTADSNGATVRFQTDTFVGTQILHCHILSHEDTGMMAVTYITGTEGGVWTGAEAVDSTCYRDGVTRGYTCESCSTASAAARAARVRKMRSLRGSF
jgi:hypothetical protein